MLATDPLTDPAYTVPPPGPSGPPGTMAWLRASVSRFAEGSEHARRRARLEDRLRALEPDALRAAAAVERDAEPAYVPVAVLARALGATDVPAAVAAVRAVAAAYHPGTDATGADAALQALLAQVGDLEAVTLLVQACESTAALVRGEATPVRVTRRLAPGGRIVEIDLTGRPFGAGPRACPGREHALALAAGVRER